MPEPESQPEGTRIPGFKLNPERHAGFRFDDGTDGLRTSIDGLCSDVDNPGMVEGELTVHDEEGYLSGPHLVAIEETEIKAGHPITIFVKEHSGKIAVGGAFTAVVTMGSLYVLHKKRK